MRILIADDSELVRNVIKQFLGNGVTEIKECSNGAEAVAAYKEFKPDWVLMDIDMPVKNGFDATRELNKLFSDVRVIMLSQYDTCEYRSEALAAGALVYINKDNLSYLYEYLFKEKH